MSLRICSAIACGRLLPAREDREGEEGHACGTCLGRVSDVPPDMLGGGGGGRAEVVEDESLGDGGECLEELCGEGARVRRQVWPRVRGLRGDQHEGGSTDLCAQEACGDKFGRAYVAYVVTNMRAGVRICVHKSLQSTV